MFRLLLLLQLYHAGYQIGRYISIERLIEQNKERYYETLERSSQGWHECIHNPWPYIGYLLYIVKEAYQEFERRIKQIRNPRGTKSAMVREAVEQQNTDFQISDIIAQCPGVSIETVRKVLKEMQKDGDIKCLSRGQGARWHRNR